MNIHHLKYKTKRRKKFIPIIYNDISNFINGIFFNNNYHIFSDSNQDKVGIGFSTAPTLLSSLHVGGDITATHVTASGNISASGTIYADNFTSTGTDVAGISFADDLNITGHITSSGDINTTAGRVYEAGTSVIDHATAMAIVFGG